MEISSGFLVAGLLMVIVGAILIYRSLRASPSELNEEDNGVTYFGPVSIDVKSERMLILTALIIASMVILYLVTKSLYPDLFGGIAVG